MDYILIDTNILIEHPRVTTIKSSKIQLGITDIVYQRFFERSINRKLQVDKYLGTYNYLDYAINNNLIKRLETKGKLNNINLNGYPQLTNAPISLLRQYEILIDEGHNVKIATDNITLLSCCESNKIPTLNLTELKDFFKDIKFDTNAIAKLKNQIQKELQKIKFEVFFAIVIALLSLLLINYFGIVKSKIGDIILIPLIITLGFILFLFREKYRLSYGIVELILGCTSIIIGVLSFVPVENKNFIELNVKIFGGLYIMVRGQENILKSIQNLIIGDRILKFLKFQRI